MADLRPGELGATLGAAGAPTPPHGPPPAVNGEEATRLRAELEEARARSAKLAAQVDELKALASAPPESPNDLRRLHLLQIQPVRDILVLLLVLGVFWLGYVLRPITIPMLIALGLAYLVEPGVRLVTRRGWMSRKGAVATMVAAVLLAILVPLGVGGAFAVAQGIEYGGRFKTQLGTLRASIDNDTDAELAARVKNEGTVEAGHAAYLDWIAASVRAPGG